MNGTAQQQPVGRFGLGMLGLMSLVVLMSAALYLPASWGKHFSSRGEPRESLATQAMVERGEWVLPRVFDDSVPSKPPLSHWIGASLAAITDGDVSEFDARAASWMLSIVFLAVYFLFLQRRFGLSQAFLSILILMTFMEWSRSSVTTRVDMTLAVWMATSGLLLFQFFEAALGDALGVSKATLLLLALSLGLATLAKGPVGLVLPLFLSGIFFLTELPRAWSLYRARLRVLSTQLLVLAAVSLLALVLASSWYIAAWIVGGAEFWNKVYSENIGRATGTMTISAHEHGIAYLFLTLLVGTLPWSLLCLLGYGVIAWKRGLCWPRVSGVYSTVRDRLLHSNAYSRFAWIQVLGTFLFFCIPASKRGVYLLPAYPYAAFLLAYALHALAPTLKEVRLGRFWQGFHVLLLPMLCLLAFLPLGSVLSGKSAATWELVVAVRNLIMSTPWALMVFAFALLFQGALFWRAAQQRTLLNTWILPWWGTMLWAFSVLLPLGSQQLALRRYLPQLIPLVEENVPLYSYHEAAYAASFYLKKPIFYISEDDPVPEGLLFVYRKHLNLLQQELGPGKVLTELWCSEGPVRKAHYHLCLSRVSGAEAQMSNADVVVDEQATREPAAEVPAIEVPAIEAAQEREVVNE